MHATNAVAGCLLPTHGHHVLCDHDYLRLMYYTVRERMLASSMLFYGYDLDRFVPRSTALCC